MRRPKIQASISSLGKQRRQRTWTEDADIIACAISSLNKFTNDGSFRREFLCQQKDDSSASLGSLYAECGRKVVLELVSSELWKPSEEAAVIKVPLSANQLAESYAASNERKKMKKPINLWYETTLPISIYLSICLMYVLYHARFYSFALLEE